MHTLISLSISLVLYLSAAYAQEDENAASCGEIQLESGDYDETLHIGAIFMVFASSICGSLLPVLNTYIPCLRKSRRALELLNSFGFGVVLATAFIHMIPLAIDALNDKCLNLSYSGLAMVIVISTIFIMQLLETELIYLLTRKDDAIVILEENRENCGAKNPQHFEVVSNLSQYEHLHHSHHSHRQNVQQDKEDSSMRRKINVLIFEIGVAIHSVIIGLNLGVATGTTFTTLLFAICFHQFFEGVAVGSSAISAFSSLKSSMITAISFSLTTPIGLILGILVHSTYSETSTTSLWVRGILDAIAGGILVYTAIVELLTYKYTINTEFHGKTIVVRGLNYTALWLGAAAMAIIGYWA